MAVNISGAGGVAPGTLYVATRGQATGTLRIARYQPSGSGMAFVGGWEVTKTEGSYERCGVALALPKCPVRIEAAGSGVDVDVDQTTGNVYVFSVEGLSTGNLAVTVFKPDGSEELGRFAEKAKAGELTSVSEEKVHESPYPGGIAVSGGTVYVFDVNAFDKFFHRLMTFKETTPGNPKTYAYVKGGDIASGFFGEGNFPFGPVTDATGDIYVGMETFIEKYTPSQPKTPVCKFTFAEGGIKSMTVNPVTGEVFFYTSADKKVHRLGPCNAGKFSEIPNTAMAVEPERDNLFALAFDTRKLEETREPGILYGAAPSPKAGTGGAGEPGMGSLGYIFAPAAEAEPVIESQAVANVGTTSAEVEAQINPRGSLTSYTFQYISEEDFLADGEEFSAEDTIEIPVPPVLIGSGLKAVHASALLTGLSPDTAYRFRAVATSNCSGSEPLKVCKDAGDADPLRTYPAEASGPPDGRAYELVSPVEKNGGQVLPAEPLVSSCGLLECKPGTAFNHFPMQSAPNGEAVVYEGTPFSPSGALIENEYLARRTASGWVNTNLTPPLLQSKGGQGYKAFTDDLSEGILEQVEPALSPAAPEGFANLYLQPTSSLALTPLNTTEPPNRSSGSAAEGSFRITYAAHSADFTHQIFEANDALTKETAFAPGAKAGTDVENNLYEWTAGALRLVNVFPDESTEPGAVLGSGTLLKAGNPNVPASVVDHAISADGKRIFWTSKAGVLYVREDGQTTTKIEDPGKFLVASADGSRVLLNDGCLYVLASKSCTDLTDGEGGFLGVAGRAEDLSRIYFVDNKVLSTEPNSEGDVAVGGKPNLYAWIDGEPEPQVGFVATLLAGDSSDWQASPAVRTAEAAPAGRYLAFQSTAQLTGVPNVGACQLNGKTGEYENAPCPEVFLYDSETAELSCPSCNPSGTAPLGESVLRLIKGAQGYLAQPRYLLDNGRLYFDSRDSLTYSDTNEGVEDVYQFEPEGLGGCTREGGCVSLVSGGRAAGDSNFLTVDAAGGNVFFTTREQLVPADKDQLIDLYDARIGGGFPKPAPVIPCGGETCQPSTPVPAEAPPAPPSNAGNYKPPKCKKGQVRRQGKCVKKPKKKSKQGSKGKAKAKKQGGSK